MAVTVQVRKELSVFQAVGHACVPHAVFSLLARMILT